MESIATRTRSGHVIVNHLSSFGAEMLTMSSNPNWQESGQNMAEM